MYAQPPPSNRGGVQRSQYLRLRPEEVAFFERLYSIGDPKNLGEMTSQTVYKLFGLSDLPHSTLAAIWKIAAQNRSNLTKDDFFVALRLVALAQKGHDVTPENVMKHLELPLPFFRDITPSQSSSYQAPPASQAGGPSYQPAPMSNMSGMLSPVPAPAPTASALSTSAPGAGADCMWDINDREKTKYMEFFDMADVDHDKFVSGAEAKSFFEKSSLNPRQLHDIWKLSDVDGDNRLSLNEFVVAMHLIMKVRSLNVPVPDKLPAPLVSFIHSKPSTSTVMMSSISLVSPPPAASPISAAAPTTAPVSVVAPVPTSGKASMDLLGDDLLSRAGVPTSIPNESYTLNDDFFEFGGSAQSVAPKIESKKAVEVPPAPPKKITIAPVIVQNSNKSADGFSDDFFSNAPPTASTNFQPLASILPMTAAAMPAAPVHLSVPTTHKPADLGSLANTNTSDFLADFSDFAPKPVEIKLKPASQNASPMPSPVLAPAVPVVHVVTVSKPPVSGNSNDFGSSMDASWANFPTASNAPIKPLSGVSSIPPSGNSTKLNVPQHFGNSGMLQADIPTQKQQNRAIADDFFEAQQKSDEQKKEIDQLKSELSALHSAADKMRTELSEVRAQHAAGESEIAQLKIGIADSTVQNVQLNSELAQAREELSTVSALLHETSAEAAAIQHKAQQSRTEISEARASIARMESEIDKTRHDSQDVELELDLSQKELQSFHDRLKQITELVQNQSSIVSTRSEQRQALTKERTVLTDKISAAQRELAQLKHQNALLKDETTSLKSELEMLQSQHDDAIDVVQLELSEQQRLKSNLSKSHPPIKTQPAPVVVPAAAPATVSAPIPSPPTVATVLPPPSPPKHAPATQNSPGVFESDPFAEDPFAAKSGDLNHSQHSQHSKSSQNANNANDSFGAFDNDSFAADFSAVTPMKPVQKLKDATPVFDYAPSTSDKNDMFEADSGFDNPFEADFNDAAATPFDMPQPAAGNSDPFADDAFGSVSASGAGSFDDNPFADDFAETSTKTSPAPAVHKPVVSQAVTKAIASFDDDPFASDDFDSVAAPVKSVSVPVETKSQPNEAKSDWGFDSAPTAAASNDDWAF